MTFLALSNITKEKLNITKDESYIVPKNTRNCITIHSIAEKSFESRKKLDLPRYITNFKEPGKLKNFLGIILRQQTREKSIE